MGTSYYYSPGTEGGGIEVPVFRYCHGGRRRFIKRIEEAEKKTGKEISDNAVLPDPTGSVIYTIVSLLVPFLLLIVGMNWIMRKMNKGGGMMGGVGKSKAKAYVQKENRSYL